MKGYFAFPPPFSNTSTSAHYSKPRYIEPHDTRSNQSRHDEEQLAEGGQADQCMDVERLKRLERERQLGESSEIEWVRAGGVLRDAFGRRDKGRTERIREELNTQDLEREKMEGWKAYEERWRSVNSSTEPIVFTEFPWPLRDRMTDRDLRQLKSRSVSEFLFESLSVRTNTTTKKERIRGSLLRWHPDKISLVLNRVVPDDVELVREGIHVVFGILKALQDAERTGPV